MSGIGPQLPPQLRKTYAIRHDRRQADCHEVIDGYVVCPRYFHGWVTRLSPTEHAAHIHHLDSGNSGRHFTKEIASDGLHVYTFPPGQTCFQSPHTIVDRQEDPHFVLLGGDHRQYIGERDAATGNVKPFLVHTNADTFMDDFASHQEALARAAE